MIMIVCKFSQSSNHVNGKVYVCNSNYCMRALTSEMQIVQLRRVICLSRAVSNTKVVVKW